MAKGNTPLPSYEAIMRHKQERMENGFLFPLTATSIGFDEVIDVRIRRLSTVDRAAIEQLPQELQTTVWEGLQEFQREQAKMRDMEDPDSILEMMSNNEKILKAADAWCLAAFIHPRLVRTTREITDSDTWPLAAVEPEDRIAVLMLSLDADSPQVRKLKMFRPQWGRDAENGGALPVGTETEPSVGPAESGVYAVPVS